MRKRRLWAESYGLYGYRVRIEERRPGGMIYARLPILPYRGEGPRYRETSLGHSDKDRAKEWAQTESDKLRAGTSGVLDPVPTAARIFARYVSETKPDKGTSSQELDTRASRMWSRWLGGAKDLSKLTPSEWRGFIRARSSGAIDAQGQPVPETDSDGNPLRRPVRTRTVENDLEWLTWVLRWATKERDADGRYLLTENPARGYPVPHEQNPRRPVATHDRYEALLAVADHVCMDVRADGKRKPVRSYLRELLEIVNGTARRISAVCQLRYENLRLARSKAQPHGAIGWPGQTDKMGKPWAAPLNATTRAAVDRILSQRPGIGAAFLFPLPSNHAKPVHKDLVSDWLRKAEQLAELPHLGHGGWHTFRRLWATARKHHPIQDVMAAGGWDDPTCLQTLYQQADDATVYKVVSEPTELREAGSA